MKITPQGAIRRAQIHTPGTGYHVGSLADVAGGFNGQVKVRGLIGTSPFYITVRHAGELYSDNLNVATVGGGGTGLTLDIETVTTPTVGLPPGAGNQQQGGPHGNIVRMKPKHPAANWRFQHKMWANNTSFLTKAATHWAKQLTPADRVNWDAAVAITGMNGFDYYMHCNKIAQGCAFTQPDISTWNGQPPIPHPLPDLANNQSPVFPPSIDSASPTSIKLTQSAFHDGPIWVWSVAFAEMALWDTRDLLSTPNPYQIPGLQFHRFGNVPLDPFNGVQQPLEIFTPFVNAFGRLKSGHRYAWLVYPFRTDFANFPAADVNVASFICP